MRKLLNTLFITQPDAYLALDGDNIMIVQKETKLGRIPLHNLEAIITFGYTGASPALMGYCAKRNIALVFLTANGRFLARVIGESRGNVILRKKQYQISENEKLSCEIARNFITAKVYNSKWMIERLIRDYPLRINVANFKEISSHLTELIQEIRICQCYDRLRGLEGQVAYSYYKIYNQMILLQRH